MGWLHLRRAETGLWARRLEVQCWEHNARRHNALEAKCLEALRLEAQR